MIKQAISKDVFYVGASDRRIKLFENIYPIDRGVSYNSYLVAGQKTALIDSVDDAVGKTFIRKVKDALGDRKLDYFIVNHMEPDHCACIQDVMSTFDDAKLVTNNKAAMMIEEYFGNDWADRRIIVKENDILDLGNHQLKFVFAPMVHWPEVMMTYDITTATLFSADAFGSFGALSGNVFADMTYKGDEWQDEMRRYYTNIVGKYGVQVKNALAKLSGVEIRMIAPLHGPVWRKDIDKLIDKYSKWSSYQWEDKEVVIIYGSIYGHTAAAADMLAAELDNLGVGKVRIYDASNVDVSYLVAESFRCSHIVIASATYNAAIFTPIERYLSEIVSHNLQNRTIGIIENGTWSAISGSLIVKETENMKNITLLGNKVSVKAAVKEDNVEAVRAMAQEICESLKQI
ncbi:MAG: FprA family A-type flavoprotein [Christensenellales bacterium]